MKKSLFKLMKIVHLICSQLWLGGAAAALFLSWQAFQQPLVADGQLILLLVPALYRTIVLPAALICLVQGIIYATAFHFGFIRQKWLGLKWLCVILIALCTGFGSINQVFTILAETPSNALSFAGGNGLFAFTAAQIVLLVLVNILSVIRIR